MPTLRRKNQGGNSTQSTRASNTNKRKRNSKGSGSRSTSTKRNKKSRHSRSTASKRMRTSKSSSPQRPVYATRAQFDAWEVAVKQHVPTFVKAKDAVREFDSLLMCITGIPEGNRVMRVHHVGKDLEHSDERVFIRKWKPRHSSSSTVDKTKFVAFDLRGPSFYITETSKLNKKGDAGAWCKEDKGEFVISDEAFYTGAAKEGKGGVAAGVFASKLLVRYHTLCPTIGNPSKDANIVEHFSKWAISLQTFAKECGRGTKLVIRFARRPFTRSTETRSKNLRVVVPAKTVKAKCKKYYLRANRAKNSTFAKECLDCNNGDHCLAIDVHNDHTVVNEAHVSPNLLCTKTKFLSRAV